MPFEEELYTLRLFNEKADRLDQGGFIRNLLANGMQLKIVWEPGSSTHELEGLDQDGIDAFILNYRFFIQNNDRISFANMASLYDGLPVAEETKERFKQVRVSLNQFFEVPSSVTLGPNFLTFGYILDIFIYGGLAHANRQKKEEYDRWMRVAPIGQMVSYDFARALIEVLNRILAVKELNEEVIRELEQRRRQES
ncbi:MAG: hypothetical protein AABN34_20620 [Acidobacteriota bacterium]